MNKDYWVNKFNLPKNADVLFYQNPKFFRSNSFKVEHLNKETDELLKLAGKIKIYTISGIGNSHSKNNGKRLKVCLVKTYLIK